MEDKNWERKKIPLGDFSDQKELKLVADHIPGGIFRCVFDEPLTLLQVSSGFLELFGYTREDITLRFHNSFWEMIEPEDREKALKDAIKQIEKSNNKELEYRVRCKDGSSMWVLDKGYLLTEEDGRQSFCCVLVDITEVKKGQEELRLSLERYQIIMNQTNDIIFEWDIEKDICAFSANWEKKFGYRPPVRETSRSMVKLSYVHQEDIPVFLETNRRVCAGEEYVEQEVRIKERSGAYLWCRIRMTGQKNAKGKTVRAVGVIVEIDEEKRRSEELLEEARRDLLTKLYNKGTAHRMIEELLKSNRQGKCAALMIIDIDDFKFVNDSMGHLFGDAFLMEVSREIQKQFRSSDIVGRVGGDEFLVYIPDIPDQKIACEKAMRVVQAFSKLSFTERGGCGVSCSIGIAMFPEHGEEFQELFKRADYALYCAKDKGKNQYVLYDKGSMDEFTLGASRQVYSRVSEKIDSDEGARSLSGSLVEYIFRILYQSVEIEAAVAAILEIVGRQFDVSRAYIFENTQDDLHCSNTFEWCNEGVSPEIDNLQWVSYEADLAGNYLDNFNEEGIFYCRDVASLGPEQYAILEPQGIKSMLQCAIREKGKIKGYVGFDECRSNRFWTQEQVDALTFIAEILSTFLLKYRTQVRAEQMAESMENILDNQNSWIYVIDAETYELLYINQKTKDIAPKSRLGMKCHQAYFEIDHPCKVCPAARLDEAHSNCTMEVYNPVLKVWSAADASFISWKGKPAVLLSCHDITRFMGGKTQS